MEGQGQLFQVHYEDINLPQWVPVYDDRDIGEGKQIGFARIDSVGANGTVYFETKLYEPIDVLEKPPIGYSIRGMSPSERARKRAKELLRAHSKKINRMLR